MTTSPIRSLLFKSYEKKINDRFYHTYACYIARPLQCTLLNHPNNILRTVQYIHLFIMLLSAFSYVCLISSKHYSQHILSSSYYDPYSQTDTWTRQAGVHLWPTANPSVDTSTHLIVHTVPWLQLLLASLSQQGQRFNPRSVHIGYLVHKVALAQVLLWVFVSYPVSIISPMLHTRLICHQHYMLLAIDVIINLLFQFPFILHSSDLKGYRTCQHSNARFTQLVRPLHTKQTMPHMQPLHKWAWLFHTGEQWASHLSKQHYISTTAQRFTNQGRFSGAQGDYHKEPSKQKLWIKKFITHLLNFCLLSSII